MNIEKKTGDLHRENYISISFHSEWDMIVVTVLSQIEIPFGSKPVTAIISHSLGKEMEI